MSIAPLKGVFPARGDTNQSDGSRITVLGDDAVSDLVDCRV
jgi:hypothetical protein